MLISTNSNLHEPWNSTQPTLSLLKLCKTSIDINQIHARLITTGFIKNTTVTAKIVLAFSSSNYAPLVDFSRYVFFKYHAFRFRREVFLWNALIKSYSHGSDPKQGFCVLCLMLQNGVFVDGFSFSLVLKACSRVGFGREGMQIHGLLMKMDIGSDLFLQNCLIRLYVKCGFLRLARQLFDMMPHRDSVSYNSMIDGYIKLGLIESAREVFDFMPAREKNLISWNTMISGYTQSEDGIKFARELFDEMPERDLISWNSMIDACVKCGRMDQAKALFGAITQKDVVSWTNMIAGYSRKGMVGLARELFDEMPERDLIAYNTIMTCYHQNGYCSKALEIFHDMQKESQLLPNETTFLIVLSSIAQLGNLDKGIAIHLYLTQKKFHFGGKLGVALIDMYSKCGNIKEALTIFELTQQKNVDHWNAMINGLAIHGLGELAFKLLLKMKKLNIKPDDITFIGILNACGHAGLVKEGLICFELMRRHHKLEPKLQHYGCMVDILARAGLIEEAKRFVEEMPIEPNDIIWRTLLSACKNHMNFNIGEAAGKRLTTEIACNSSSYVLLSNMYAELGMWSDVIEIREMMKKRNIKKIPGCSWIELDGINHEFFVQDMSHPQCDEIYHVLDGLLKSDSEIVDCRTYI